MLATDDKNSVLSEASKNGRKARAYSAYGYSADDATTDSGLGYNGELRDATTGHYLLGKGYRVFSPQLMRFYSPDSWSPFGRGGVNAYAYVSGNPMMYSDPTGHVLEKVVGLVAKAALKLDDGPGAIVSVGAKSSAHNTDAMIAKGKRIVDKASKNKPPEIPPPDYPWSSPPKSSLDNAPSSAAGNVARQPGEANRMLTALGMNKEQFEDMFLANAAPPDGISPKQWKKMGDLQKRNAWREQLEVSRPEKARSAQTATSTAEVSKIRNADTPSRGKDIFGGKRHPHGRWDY